MRKISIFFVHYPLFSPFCFPTTRLDDGSRKIRSRILVLTPPEMENVFYFRVGNPEFLYNFIQKLS